MGSRGQNVPKSGPQRTPWSPCEASLEPSWSQNRPPDPLNWPSNLLINTSHGQNFFWYPILKIYTHKHQKSWCNTCLSSYIDKIWSQNPEWFYFFPSPTRPQDPNFWLSTPDFRNQIRIWPLKFDHPMFFGMLIPKNRYRDAQKIIIRRKGRKTRFFR